MRTLWKRLAACRLPAALGIAAATGLLLVKASLTGWAGESASPKQAQEPATTSTQPDGPVPIDAEDGAAQPEIAPPPTRPRRLPTPEVRVETRLYTVGSAKGTNAADLAWPFGDDTLAKARLIRTPAPEDDSTAPPMRGEFVAVVSPAQFARIHEALWARDDCEFRSGGPGGWFLGGDGTEIETSSTVNLDRRQVRTHLTVRLRYEDSVPGIERGLAVNLWDGQTVLVTGSALRSAAPGQPPRRVGYVVGVTYRLVDSAGLPIHDLTEAPETLNRLPGAQPLPNQNVRLTSQAGRAPRRRSAVALGANRLAHLPAHALRQLGPPGPSPAGTRD